MECCPYRKPQPKLPNQTDWMSFLLTPASNNAASKASLVSEVILRSRCRPILVVPTPIIKTSLTAPPCPKIIYSCTKVVVSRQMLADLLSNLPYRQGFVQE